MSDFMRYGKAKKMVRLDDPTKRKLDKLQAKINENGGPHVNKAGVVNMGIDALIRELEE